MANQETAPIKFGVFVESNRLLLRLSSSLQQCDSSGSDFHTTPGATTDTLSPALGGH